MNIFYYVFAVVWSAMFTAALLFVRARVRTNRQRLITELSALFFPGERCSVAALDYIRAKYEMQTKAEAEGRKISPPTSTMALLGAAIPYMILCALGFIVLFVPKKQLEAGTFDLPMLYDNFFWHMSAVSPAPAGALSTAAAIYAAAFLGGYLMTARVLLRAVQNYELTQLTFLRAAAHLAFGLVSGLMIFHVLRTLGPNDLLTGDWSATASSGFLLLAFMGGYMPDLGIINLSRRLHVRWLKTPDDKALNAASIMPLEMLDGIDYDIRYRLEEAGFVDVQNLAVANPLLIYVETPYTLYQAFDWVLQAQLCLAVGGDTFRHLKKHNIRTSLDLERAVLGDDAPDEFILSVGALIFPSAAAALTTNFVRHGVMVMLDDLHVHRLRTLWELIFDQISGTGKRQWIYRTTGGLNAVRETAHAI